jgi:peptide/nickel transport system substrate-binding protein
LRNQLIVLLASLTLMTGCVRKPPAANTTNNTTHSATASGSAAGAQFGANPALLFPDPGPFGEATVKNSDGSLREALVARGDIGKPGGALTLSTFGSGPKTFNPWQASDVESGGIALLMFERLLELDAWTGKIYPRLAKSFTVSNDKTEYTFKLRKGLQWSDGKPLTADDVVFTFGTIVAKGYGNQSHRDILSVYNKYPTVTKVDDLTIKFKTAVPFAPFLNGLRSVPIAPKHIFEPVTKKKMTEFAKFWDVNMNPADMVSSGCFILERYVPGQRVELKRNPKYFMVDRNNQPLPYLSEFNIGIVPDQNTQTLKFYGGEIDMLDIRSVRGNEAAIMKTKEKSGNFTMYNLGPDEGTVFLLFNMARRQNPKTKKPYVDPIKQKWFNDRNFRQAVSHALDRNRIINNVLKGVGLPLYTAESPASLYFNSKLEPYGQDLNLSTRLLEKSGFKLRDGVLRDADGHPVEFSLLTNAGNTQRDGTCVTIVNELKKLGMKVNYQPVDFNILVDKLENSLDFDACVMGLSGDRIEPYSGANVWKSDGRLHMFDQRIPDDTGKTTVTDARPWEKRIDELFDKGATTFDTAQRKAIFDEFQQIAYDEMPFIYILSILDLTAVRNTIKNYRPMTYGIFYTPMGSLHNIEEIYIDKASN